MARLTSRLGVRPTADDHQATTLELFFDLVFVFAFTQVTQLMADDPTAAGALRGLVVLSLLWWAWSSYAWLSNQVHADVGVTRLFVLAAMAVMFLAALAIPESFDDLPGGLSAPLVFAVCYALMRILHVACYLVAASGQPELRRQVRRAGSSIVVASALLIVGAILGAPHQTWVWLLALVVDYAGIWLAGPSGWQLRSAPHFAERHGLIVLIAIGESLVAIGVGVAQEPVATLVVVVAVLGVAVAVCLWWLYFDHAADQAEHALAEARGVERVRLARTAYTYLHFPLIVSIVFIALGLKKVLTYVADPAHYGWQADLPDVPLAALLLGSAAFLVAQSSLSFRVARRWSGTRLVAAGLLVAAWLVVTVGFEGKAPVLVAISVVAIVLVGLTIVATTRSSTWGRVPDGRGVTAH